MTGQVQPNCKQTGILNVLSSNSSSSIRHVILTDGFKICALPSILIRYDKNDVHIQIVFEDIITKMISVWLPKYKFVFVTKRAFYYHIKRRFDMNFSAIYPNSNIKILAVTE